MYRNQYDTDCITWSPQGRLFQVEYAMEAVKQGTCCVGIKSSTHIVLCAVRRKSSRLADYQDKLFRIGDYIGVAMSGITSDAKMIVNYMRNECLNNRFLYGCDITAEKLVSLIAQKSQANTQTSSKRPFGVGLLVAGYDDKTGLRLYETCPSGNVLEYNSAKTYLERKIANFKESELDSLIYHAVKAVKLTVPSDGEQLRVINNELRLSLDRKHKTDASENDDEIRKKAQKHVDVYLLSEDYYKTVEYARDKLVFQIVSSLMQNVISIMMLFTFFGPILWHFSGSLLKTPSETYQVGAFVAVFYLFMMVIYPDFIAPLFNKFEPLNDDDLKEGIEALAKRLKFPLREIKLMDGSRRSNHSNMYFYGFWWFKKIVMYDTLLKQPKSQIIAITSHELGHWKCNHTLKLLLFSFAQLFAIFYLFGLYKDDASMFESFGYGNERAFIVGITLFGYIYTPLGVVLHLIGTTITRRGEYEADNFAVKMGYGDDLAKALVEIHHKNKSMIHHDPLYSWYHFTHPVLFERVYAIYKAMADKKI
ncbi:Proteasome subunit alpha type-1 [Babesia sp. Xinjiang]|uniref:Proteasome subunit alpha type-1 n=1 Tax=Babesia sp. Xinjiang TaxID=462227 RepID=UPI000A24FA2B|nr:Proteasome subunit alpha type-1 [Babesia sp. Xinjiang]ORM40279.1 Proteasome subunit alpha type-1 [Babesia sp. Xinjiang]